MIYEDINGWFDFAEIYDSAVDTFNEGIFIEIGCYEGKSTAYMAEKIKDSGNAIDFYVIDCFRGYEGDGGDVIANYNNYIKNTEQVADYITTIEGFSTDSNILDWFDDNSVSFIFIDGNHSYDYVRADIRAWLPKLKEGGMIAGHDYHNSKGVKRAVDEIFGKEITISGESWVWVK